jgi:pimeloyl-ACP methyl ester carboxylesterase
VTEPSAIRHRSTTVNGVGLQLQEAGEPGAPLVILAHGFPEGAYSWRHQLPALAAAGYHVIAPDQRGYGHSDRPDAVEAYGITQLTGDLVALADEAGAAQAVFVGHDWGALITWEVARLHPDRVRAVVGVSVPFTNWPARPTELFRALFGDRFFYMLYFQQVGPPERELEADVRHTMRSILIGGSGPAYRGMPSELPPAEGTGFLDMFRDLDDVPHAWLSDDDLDHYTAQFAASGFYGPVSYYRNLDANYDLLKDVPPTNLTMPAYFIGGERDGVIAGRPEMVDAMVDVLPDYRGKHMIPGAGHWTQQEAPEEFNAALLNFLSDLDHGA